MALSLGSEFTVNSKTDGSQYGPATASSANGMSVVVWTDQSSGSNRDIRARLFVWSHGVKVPLGPDIVVPSKVDVSDPSVAMDAQGNFAVTFTQHPPGSASEVELARYSSAGVLSWIAGDFTVKPEYDSHVASDASGHFVVTFTRDYSATDQDIVARRFDISGLVLGDVSVATSGLSESAASIAMAPDGRFDVAYQVQAAVGNRDVYMNRYSAAGVLLGHDPIATSTADELAPSVAMDNNANAVIAFEQYYSFLGHTEIVARRDSNAGVLGSDLNLTLSSYWDEHPQVALSPTGQNFVVAYTATDYSGEIVIPTLWVVEVTNGDWTPNHISVGSNLSDPGISIDGTGTYILVYTGFGATNSEDIKGRLGHF